MKKGSEKESMPMYQPTDKEKRLLEVLLNPQHMYASVLEICSKAKVNRSAYYRAFKKPGFASLYTQESIALTRKASAPVVNACIKFAVRGSAPHARIILTMAGVYSEKKEIIFPDENGKPQSVAPETKIDLSILTDEELKAYIAIVEKLTGDQAEKQAFQAREVSR